MPTTDTAEWMLLLLRLPGKRPVPAGVLLLESPADRLWVKLKPDFQLEDPALEIIWSNLADHLRQQALEQGASQVAAWLETSASHVVQLSCRDIVDLKSSSFSDTVEKLYSEHVES